MRLLRKATAAGNELSRARVNFALISVRISSPATNGTSTPSPGIRTMHARLARSRISIHSRSWS